MKLASILATTILSLAIGTPALAAGERGTPDEAKSLVKKAIAHFKAHGQEKTMAALNDPKGAFIDRDLYVFVHDDEGIYFAIAPKPTFIGKNMTEVKDANGKYIVKDQIEKLKTADSMWQEYDWQNPVTGKIEHKKTYCEKVGKMQFCSGAYAN
ncbi:MAG: cache domain-containing protein [Actinomycetota bacterium]